MKVFEFILNVFKSKSILYLVAFLSLLNLFGYMIFGNINAIIYYIIIALIMTIFSNNMIVILLVPLLLVSFLLSYHIIKEGFSDISKNYDEEELKDVDKDISDAKDKWKLAENISNS